MNMNDYNIFFVLIIEVIRILITRKFALVFLDSSENKIKTLTAYISSVILTGSAYYISNISWLNLLCTFLGLTFISLAHRGSIKERVLFVLCVLSLSCIVDLIVYSLFGKTYAFTNYYEISNIVDLIFLLAAQVFTKKFIDKNRYNEMESRDLYKYVVSLIVCVATSLVIITDNSISSVSLLIVCGSFLIINLIMIFLLDDISEKQKNKTENQILRDQMDAYEREISIQNEKSEQLRALRHDMKRHIAEINAIARKGDYELLEEYIGSIEDVLKDTTPICDSGNSGLDTILNYMLSRAVSKNIHVKTKLAVPKDVQIAIYDMNVILGNLIENAIEANEDVENPQIDILINYVKGSLAIELSNTYHGEIQFKGDLPVTTKKEKEKHGYGIMNIKKVLDKYNHTLDFDVSDDRFTVRILMKVT